MAEAAFDTPAKEDNTMPSTNNKRKRTSLDTAPVRPAPGFSRSPGNTNNNDMDFPSNPEEGMHLTEADFNALAQHGGDHSTQSNGSNVVRDASDTAAAALTAYNGMTVPQPTEMQFQNQPTAGDHNSSFDLGGSHQFGLDALKDSPAQGSAGSATQGSPTHKPAVGSDEWHRVRRDNHKEVERRRRETINEGINELAKIVPGCEKNKGSILQRAVQFITQLKENEAQNIEKWTLEKLLTEQAIAELSASCDKFKNECQRAWQEVEIYKTACNNAGIIPDEIRNRENADGGGDS
ncbi:hypothetical protein NA57DRAFT_77775 [Rhizodiscina lignyota]|uniref:BHLH domain-containing protein n=1 Tax=Rhizodiscina lignyota TaxID=1504668 RepID=A0A9P4ICL6_9PEZI|nr:hypothetical protein NA57DRAFT_77775 [Rhizodiscina lignyota]